MCEINKIGEDCFLIIRDFSCIIDIINMTSTCHIFYEYRKLISIEENDLENFIIKLKKLSNFELIYNFHGKFSWIDYVYILNKCYLEIIMMSKNTRFKCESNMKEIPSGIKIIEFTNRFLGNLKLNYGVKKIIFTNNCDIHDNIYIDNPYNINIQIIFKNKYCPLCFLLGYYKVNFNKMLEEEKNIWNYSDGEYE